MPTSYRAEIPFTQISQAQCVDMQFENAANHARLPHRSFRELLAGMVNELETRTFSRDNDRELSFEQHVL